MKDVNPIFVVQLYNAWAIFLDHAGKYATRYYMSCNLELPPQMQNPKLRATTMRLYRTEGKLLRAIEQDLETFPEELQAIRDAQVACGLPAFPDRSEYLDQIAMGFAMLDRHGKERRNYYRRRIKKMLETLNHGGTIAAQSLNLIEADFQESQRKSAERKARKLAQAS